jgi:hypothetical protein
MELKMKKVATVASAVIILVGCATASKDTSLTDIFPMQYQPYDCERLASETQRIQVRVNQLGGRLDEAAASDKAITGADALLFWPVLFALGGTKVQEAEYACLNG